MTLEAVPHSGTAAFNKTDVMAGVPVRRFEVQQVDGADVCG